MSQQQQQDELAATQTEGYKLGEKKDISELKKLDANDESLNKWKASLGLTEGDNTVAKFPDDKRTVLIQALIFKSDEREIRMDLSSPKAIEELSKREIIIKEGVSYTFSIEFYIQREVISGLKYIHVLKRKGIPVEKTQDMCGSFGPSMEIQTAKVSSSEMPSGLLARGHYLVKSRVIDDDNVIHLEWTWNMEIKKDWK